MIKDNPFTLAFGYIPNKYINRIDLIDNITEIIKSENPSTRTFLITGVRGSGKTVLLTSIEKKFIEDNNYIVIDINPELNMLESFASKLYDRANVKHLFMEKDFNISFHGISFSLTGKRPVTNIESVIEEMLKVLKKNNIKVIIAIDEVTVNEYIKAFSHTFQILLREEFNLFLIMTGLYENIFNLQNEKSLTFLYRAPKIYLDPLSINRIANSYVETFNIDINKALYLASETKGYAFAYQALGYVLWEQDKKEIDDDVLRIYDEYLFDYVYEKLWSSLSTKDKNVLKALKGYETDVSTLIKESNIKQNELSVYKDRLVKKGIILANTWGTINLSLPRFLEFIQRKKLIEEINI